MLFESTRILCATMVLTQEDRLIEISDRLLVMRQQEAAQYAVPDYLSTGWQQKLIDGTEPNDIVKVAVTPSTPRVRSSGDDVSSPYAAEPRSSGDDVSSPYAADPSSRINELWREKMCEWLYQIVDHLDFDRENVSVAMSHLDRYLATLSVDRRIFKLAGMTALYIAIKVYETGELNISGFIELSCGYFKNEHIVAMENSMLPSLNWYVHPPTPIAFCRDLMSLVSGDISESIRHDVMKNARFMTELSVCEYWFVSKKPSSIALASLVNAIELQGPHRISDIYKKDFLRRVVQIGIDIVNDKDFLDCYERLSEIYTEGGFTSIHEESNLPAVIVDPVGEMNDPVVNDLKGGEESMMSVLVSARKLNTLIAPAVRVVSPNTPSPSKRKAHSSPRSSGAKEASVNLTTDFSSEEESPSSRTRKRNRNA